jgi:GTP-binding nuclear protein Ran
MATPIYKVVFMGDGGVGKTALLHRYVRNYFEKVYKPTIGAEVLPIGFQTNYGSIQLNIYDTAGQEKYSGLRDGYLINAHHVVIFYSVDSSLSARNISFWEKDAGLIPTTIIGTKADMANKVGLDTPVLSSKTGQGITAFWQQLLAKLTGHADIVLTE